MASTIQPCSSRSRFCSSRSGALIQSAVLRPFASLHLLRIIVIHDSSNIAGILKAVGSSGAWRRCCCKWRSFRRRKHSCTVLFPSLFEVRHARVQTSFFCYCCLLCYCCVCTVHLSEQTNRRNQLLWTGRWTEALFTSTILTYLNMHYNHYIILSIAIQTNNSQIGFHIMLDTSFRPNYKKKPYFHSQYIW